MAKVSGKNAIILIGGNNFSTFASQYNASADAGKIDVTGFTDASQNFIPGLPKATINANLLWDSDTDSVHDSLSPMPSGSHVTIFPEGYVLGNQSLSLPFMQGNYNPTATPESSISIGDIAFESYGNNDGLEYGWALAHATITDTTTGTGFVDPTDGAVTAKCSGTLHIWTPTIDDTYVVKIQHSTSLGSGYVDLVTFTLDGSAKGSERITVASGTVNKYRRVVATRTGTDADPFGFSVHFWHG
jgi:hypothetical protein